MYSYVYVLKHIPTGKFYVGSKKSKKSAFEVLLKTYFSSSKVVKSLLSEGSVEDFCIVSVKYKDDYVSAVSLENKILRAIKKRDVFLNVNFCAGGAVVKSNTHTKITKDSVNYIYWPRHADLPLGYWEEYPFSPPNRVGWKKITDGSTVCWLKPEQEMPKGFLFLQEYRKMQRKGESKRSGWVWYTDGIVNKRVRKGDLAPEGYYKGVTLSPRSKPRRGRGSTSDKICINNGITNAFIKSEDVIPDGWVKGLLRDCSDTRSKRVYINDVAYSNFKTASLQNGFSPSYVCIQVKKHNTNRFIIDQSTKKLVPLYE